MQRRLQFIWRYLRGDAPWDSGIVPPEIVTWIETALADVVSEAHRLGAMWDRSRTLISHAVKARAGAS